MRKLLSIGICAVILFYACSKSGKTPDTQNAIVYVAGNCGGDTAVYWKNGERAVLSSDSAYCVAITVSGSDRYVVGQLGAPKGGYYLAYWKNDEQPTKLDVSNLSYIDGRATNDIPITNSIAVSGADVYVLANGNGYWENGQFSIFEDDYRHSTLVDTTFVGYGTGIAVTGNTVYICGQYIGMINDLPNSETPAYWKITPTDTQLVQLSPHSATAEGIVVSGSDVYVVGYTAGDSAVYWKNGQLIVLAQHAIATALAVSNNNVYVCGYTSGGAVYWKNGQQFSLGNNSEAKGIAVSGNDVYVCGIAGYNSYPYPPYYAAYDTAVYWKNGKEVVLGSNAGATSIAVE